MGLPISGFPNMQAMAQEDDLGQNYVNTIDFLKVSATSCMVGRQDGTAAPLTALLSEHV